MTGTDRRQRQPPWRTAGGGARGPGRAAPRPAGHAVADVPAASATAPAHTAKTFVLGIKQDIDSFNPYVGVVATAFEVYR